MECREVQERLRRGAPLDTPAVRAHLADCPPCAFLASEPALFGALAAAEPREPAPPPPVLPPLPTGPSTWATPLRSMLAADAVALPLIWAVWKMRGDLASVNVFALSALLTGMICAIVAGVLTAVRPFHRAPVALAPVLVLALLPPWLQAVVPVAAADPDALGHAHVCFGAVLACGLPSLVALTLLDRWPASVARGAMLGAAAGLVGTLALALKCPIDGPIHLAVGHALAASMLAALGAAVGAARARAVA